MKKLAKIILVLIIAMMLCMTISNVSLAAGDDSSDKEAATTAAPNPNGYKGLTEQSEREGSVKDIENFGNKIITIISTMGSIVSVIVLVVLGVKYMVGSAEEKAEYKKTLLPYVIGAALVFAASSIAGIIFSFTQGL